MESKSIQIEFDDIQKRISQIRGQLLIKNMRNELEIISFLSMIKERPTLSYAYDFLQKLKNQQDESLKSIERGVVDHIELIKHIKIEMHGYWKKNTSCRQLITDALKGGKNKLSFCKIKKDWK